MPLANERLDLRILITGGLGYLGGRLAQYLSQINHEIIVATRGRHQTYEYLENVSIHQIDWNDELSINQVCKGCDVVIHAAGIDANSCVSDPINALQFNGVATAKLLKSSITCGVNNFIYFSTAHVYSENLSGFFNESSQVTNLHPYATSHKAGEDSVLYLSQKKEINGIIFRISNGFGAPVDPNTNCWSLLVNDICKQAVTTNKIKLRTSGLKYRNFIPIQDLIKIVEFFLSYDYKKYFDDLPIFNIGSSSSMTVYDMALLVSNYYEEKYGNKIKIEKKEISHFEKDSFNPKLIYNTDKLTKVLGTTLDNTRSEIQSLFSFCKKYYKY